LLYIYSFEFTINAISIEEDRIVWVFCFDKRMDKITKTWEYTLPEGIIETWTKKTNKELLTFKQCYSEENICEIYSERICLEVRLPIPNIRLTKVFSIW